MKPNPSKLLKALGFAACLTMAGAAQSAPFVGVPAPVGPIPNLGGALIDFDDRATGSAVGASDYDGVTINLLNAANCTLRRFAGSQSQPNYIGTGGGCETGGISSGWDGTVQFVFDKPMHAVGIGVADSIGVDVLNIYDSNHVLLETFVAPVGANTYAGFIRATGDIRFLEVVMDFAALDDLQFIPEPSSVLLMALGLLGLFGWRRSRVA